MLSIVIPTLQSAATLPATLRALVPGAVAGLVRQVVIADGGSRDATRAMAEAAGADVVDAARGRGPQLAAGAKAARADWLLFLHADTVLDPGWEDTVIECLDGADGTTAYYFRYRLDDAALPARLLERVVAARSRIAALPYGDQGLLISRRLYDEVGGFRDLPIMEDVDLVRRLGRRRLKRLPVTATTSAERYRREGYLKRMSRNAMCLTLWFAGMAPERIARLYGQ